MRWLILAAELVVAFDGVCLGVLYVLYRFAERRLAEFSSVEDFTLWQRELDQFLGASA